LPFDSNGNFSPAPGYLGVTGQAILTSQHNPVIEDIAAGLSVTLLRTGVAPMLANLPMGGFKMTGLAVGTAATDSVNVSQLNSFAPPIGTVVDYAGTSFAPTGWLFCAGQSLARASYTALFAVIGTQYGSLDGSSFSLPDARGRVVAGRDNMGGTSANRLTNQPGGVNGDVMGSVGGGETHTLLTAQIPAHTHSGTTAADGGHSHVIGLTGGGAGGGGVKADNGGPSSTMNTNAIGDHTHAFTTSSVGSGSAHNNVQPTIIFNKIIRTGV